MYLIQFKSHEVEKVWPLVKKHIQSALDRNYNFRNHSDVKQSCMEGKEQLWVVTDKEDNIHGVCVTAIVEQVNYNIGVVRIATGHDLPLWVDKIKDFEQWAFHNCGCKKIEIYGRPGWKKMLTPLGYEYSHVQMDKFLGGLH
jgi:hypothetical protein